MAIRMVKLDANNVVVNAIITNSVTPYNVSDYVDASGKFYQGQPVSIGWVYDPLTDSFSPPPQPSQLPA